LRVAVNVGLNRELGRFTLDGSYRQMEVETVRCRRYCAQAILEKLLETKSCKLLPNAMGEGAILRRRTVWVQLSCYKASAEMATTRISGRHMNFLVQAIRMH
jgi:hypothetical protein